MIFFLHNRCTKPVNRRFETFLCSFHAPRWFAQKNGSYSFLDGLKAILTRYLNLDSSWKRASRHFPDSVGLLSVRLPLRRYSFATAILEGVFDMVSKKSLLPCSI